MIRYPEDPEAMIAHAAPDWLRRARERTEEFRRLGRYAESSSIWSEVKPFYMRLQRNKCAYCETKLEGGERGKIQHDLEHFRPKSAVSAWPPPRSPLRYSLPLGEASATGYYLLAYHPGNYAAACKTCNSNLKRTYFPVAGTRSLEAQSPADADGEEPHLLYPLGAGRDPQDLIAFDGFRAIPQAASGPSHERAQLVIDFFDLNREALCAGRALMITTVWLAFNSDERPEDFTRPGAAHAACSARFLALCQHDRTTAYRVYREARALLRSVYA